MLHVSPHFKLLSDHSAVWDDLLGNLALKDARQSAQSGLVFAALSSAACLTSKNILVRAAAVGFGLGSFLVAAKQAKDGLALKQSTAKSKAIKGLRPEPILPKPPMVTTSKVTAKP